MCALLPAENFCCEHSLGFAAGFSEGNEVRNGALLGDPLRAVVLLRTVSCRILCAEEEKGNSVCGGPRIRTRTLFRCLVDSQFFGLMQLPRIRRKKREKKEKSYSKDWGGKFICWLEQVGGVSYDTSRAVYAEVLRSYLFGKVVPLCS